MIRLRVISDLFCLMSLLYMTAVASAQGVAINPNGNPPDASAGIDVQFTDRGALIPRLTTQQRNAIPAPAVGLQIYNLTTNCLNYFDGVNWLEVCGVCPPPAGTNAGSDQVLSDVVVTQLNANDPADGTGMWSVISGAGGSFSDESQPDSDFSGQSGTTYVLRWTVSNGCGSNYDEVNIQFLQSLTVLDGLRVWLKADEGVDTNSGSVYQWLDQSGNGNHAVQGNSGEQPTLLANQLNGHSVVRFDGANDRLLINGAQTVGTAFLVVSWEGSETSFPNYSGILTSQEDPGGAGDGIIFIGNPGSTHLYTSGIFGGQIFMNGALTTDFEPLQTHKIVSGYAPSPATVSSLQLGRDRPWEGREWNGDYAEVLVYDVVLSAPERQSVIDYLMAKWGL